MSSVDIVCFVFVFCTCYDCRNKNCCMLLPEWRHVMSIGQSAFVSRRMYHLYIVATLNIPCITLMIVKAFYCTNEFLGGKD